VLLQARDDTRMHLADARFAQVERRADLLHRHVFVIVEDDDEPLVAVEAARHEAHQVAILQAVRRILRFLVLENVDLAHVLVAVGFVPFLVEADETDGGRVAVHLLEFLDRDAQSHGHFLGARRTAQFGFQPFADFFELGMLAANQARHPVHRAQFVEHRAADARHAIGLELDAALQVEGVDRVHQAEDAGGDQIVEIDAVGQPSPDAFGVIFDQRQITFDQLVTHFDGRFRLVVAPELMDIHVHMRHHGFLRDEGKRKGSPGALLVPKLSLGTWRGTSGVRYGHLSPKGRLLLASANLQS
jgi:hypothetical protein